MFISTQSYEYSAHEAWLATQPLEKVKRRRVFMHVCYYCLLAHDVFCDTEHSLSTYMLDCVKHKKKI